MIKINEENFLQELLVAIPEFRQIHEEEKDDHEIGIHIVVGDFKRFVENAVQEKNDELLERVVDFIVRCRKESKDEAINAIYVSFFENMNEDGLNYFFEHLPKEFAEDVKKFLDAFDEATAKVSGREI